MSTADATLRLILLGDDRSASKAVTGLGSTAEKSSGKLHAFGKVAAGVFAGGALLEGAQKAAEFLKGSVEAAAEDQAANAVLARQLKNTTGATNEQIKATEEWVTKTAEASGTAKSDLTPSLTKLATVTGSVTKAQKLTTLAMNVAAGTHQNLTTVTGALVRAQNGSIGGLSRLGVATKNADGSTKTFLQVQKEMAKQFKGDTAAAADTAAGKMKRLGVTWEEMKVQIGDKLIPILSSLAGFLLNRVIPAISTFGGWVKKNSDWIKPLAAAIGGMAAAFAVYSAAMAISSAATGVWATLTGTATVATEAQAVAQGELDAAMDANPIGLVVVAIGALAAGLIYAYKHSEKFRAVVQGALHGVEVVAKGFVSVFKSLWKKWGDDITAVVKSVWKLVGAIIKADMTIVRGVIKTITSLIHGDWAGAWDGIKTIFKGFWQYVLAYVKNVPSLLGNLAHLFLGAGKALMGALFRGLKSAAGAAGGFAVSIAKSIANQLITLLNKILPHSLPINAKFIHINVPLFPNIPYLAQGGIVKARPGGSLIVAGEGGRDEAVVPLGRGGMGGGDIHVTINGALDPIAVGKQVEQVLAKLQRTRGQSAFAFSAP